MYAVPSCHILQKSIKLVLNVRKTWYHERPSSQITPIIIVQQIMRFKTVASFYRFLGKLVQESRLSSAYLWYCFWPWWIVWDICRNRVRFNNLIQMHLSTYSEVLFNVEYQGLGFLGISICLVGMISKGETDLLGGYSIISELNIKIDEEECDCQSDERVNVWWANLHMSKCVTSLSDKWKCNVDLSVAKALICWCILSDTQY